MVASSPAVQPALRVMVPAGTTAGTALRDGGAPTSGLDALVVARDAQGTLRDLTWAPESDTEVEAVPASSPDGRSVIRHSCAHEVPFTPEDLAALDRTMRKIIKAGQRFSRRVLGSVREATKRKLFEVSGHLDWYADAIFPPMHLDEELAQDGTDEQWEAATEALRQAWLAPVQVVGVPIADEHVEHLEQVAKALRARGIRVEVDASDERMQKKIRTHTTQKVPFLLLAGGKDVEAAAVSFRVRDGTQINGVGVDDAVCAITGWVARRDNRSPSAAELPIGES